MALICPHCDEEITINNLPKVICPHCNKDTRTPPNDLGKFEAFLDEAQSWKNIGWCVK